MANTYRLHEGKDIRDIACAVSNYLEGQEAMDTQTLSLENGEILIQARTRNGKLKQFVGLDKATSVRIKSLDGKFATVEVGSGKWVDKGLAMTVSMFVFWPLTITSGIGIYKQAKLPEKIQRVAELAA